MLIKVAQGFLFPHLCIIKLRKGKNLTAKQSIKHIKTIWWWEDTMTEFQLSDIWTNWLKSRTAFSWTAILKFVGTIWRKISTEMFWSALGTILDIFGSGILLMAIIAQKRDTTSLIGLLNCKKRYYTTGMKSWQGLMCVARNKAWINTKSSIPIQLLISLLR